jgi:hypothetical protein
MTRLKAAHTPLAPRHRVAPLYQTNALELASDEATEDQLTSTHDVLTSLERYWTNYITYSR